MSLVTFTAPLQKSPTKGGWYFVIWPESVTFFGTKGLVKVRGTMEGIPFKSAFMALGNGQHKLPVTTATIQQINKKVGDSLTVVIEETVT